MTNNLQRLIKQNIPFSSEKIKAEVGLLFLCNHINYHFQDFLKQYGISIQQYNVLRILRGQYPNPATVNMVRERMLDKMSDASRIIDRLEKMGMVMKTTNSADKRQTHVFITANTLQVINQLDEEVNNRNNLLIHLSDTELQQLNTLIDKAIQCL